MFPFSIERLRWLLLHIVYHQRLSLIWKEPLINRKNRNGVTIPSKAVVWRTGYVYLLLSLTKQVFTKEPLLMQTLVNNTVISQDLSKYFTLQFPSHCLKMTMLNKLRRIFLNPLSANPVRRKGLISEHSCNAYVREIDAKKYGMLCKRSMNVWDVLPPSITHELVVITENTYTLRV